MFFPKHTLYNISVGKIRCLSSDFHEFSVQNRALFPKFADMRILPSKAPISADFRMLMCTI